MFGSLDKLWEWLLGITPPEPEPEPETEGNFNTLPETNNPQHTHLELSPEFRNK